MTALCLCVVRKMSSASPARACMSASIVSLSFVVARFSPVPSFALRMEEVDAATTQEWSLRLNLTQHRKTHQVQTQ